MILFILMSSLLLGGVIGDKSLIGTSFFIPEINLLGESIAGGYPVLKDLDANKCIKTKDLAILDNDEVFFKDTEMFYSSIATSTSLSADLAAEYSLGVTLDITTKHVSGNSRQIRGYTLNMASKTKKDYLESRCKLDAELDDHLREAFENLPQTIKNPSLDSSWNKYRIFLDKFNSHVVKEVIYGSSLYQHCFSDSKDSYSEKEYTIDACVKLAGLTEVGKLGIGACQGITKAEIEEVKYMKTQSTFILRGGTLPTRAALNHKRTKELIEDFMDEAKTVSSPIQYKFTPIWNILKIKYLGTEHFAKALNLEAFYKGYQNFGCHYKKSNTNVELQKFVTSGESTESHPSYECMIAPQGCQAESDCHLSKLFWCECYGDSCVKYKNEKENNGVSREVPYIYRGSDFVGHCQDFGCSCTQDKNWKIIWSPSDDESEYSLLVHEKFRKDRMKCSEPRRTEL